MVPFQFICPKIALQEERTVVLTDEVESIFNDSERMIDYTFVEHYCQEKGCDCRRVLLQVYSNRRQTYQATISFGFDPKDPLRGPYLDPLNKQGPCAKTVMQVFREYLLTDSDYIERLEYHYRIARQVVSGKLDPDDAKPFRRASNERYRISQGRIDNVRNDQKMLDAPTPDDLLKFLIAGMSEQADNGYFRAAAAEEKRSAREAKKRQRQAKKKNRR